MPATHPLSQAFRDTLRNINNAALAAERPPPRLLAVSKTQPASAVAALAALGQRAFGENYVQEAVAKQQALADSRLEWHLIGHLQSNKCRAASEHFDWVQSLDRIGLISPLGRFRPAGRGPLNVLVQVHVDGEASKSGCAPDAASGLARAIAAAPNLRLRGVMGIGAPWPDFEQRRDSFRRLCRVFADLRAEFPECDTLSMGMSEDYPLAIEEGATLVRVGSSLFGPRT